MSKWSILIKSTVTDMESFNIGYIHDGKLIIDLIQVEGIMKIEEDQPNER